MQGRIIRQNDPKEVEQVNFTGFVSPKRMSERIADAQKEYDDLRAKIEALYLMSEQKGFEEGHRKGQDEGFNDGLKQGYDEGFKQGIKDGKAQVFEQEGDVLKLLNQYTEQIHNDQTRYIQQSDEVIVDLIGEIVQKILETRSKEDPTVILRITKKAIEKLSHASQVILHINPRDFEAIEANRERMERILAGINNFRIEENNSVAPGSCKLETLSGVIDADFVSQINIVKELLRSSLEAGTSPVSRADGDTENAEASDTASDPQPELEISEPTPVSGQNTEPEPSSDADYAGV